MKKQDLANAFDLLEPSQEAKYNVRNTINAKTGGRKPFFKRFKRPALALTCFILASILVITAAAAGGVQLFSLIYGSEVANYEKYISAASETVSTENVNFTLEGVFYDGFQGVAIVSLEALNETGKELIEQFNTDIIGHVEWSYPPSDDFTGMEFYYKYNPDTDEQPILLCSKHMTIQIKDPQQTDWFDLASSLFTISPLTGALGDDKNYYKIYLFNGDTDMSGLQIGWTENGETVLTDFDVSLITNTIEIDCSETETAAETPTSINAYKIVVSPMAIYVLSHTKNRLRIDDQFLVKFKDGSIYDLYDGGNYGDPGVYGDYHAFPDDDSRKGYSTSSRYGYVDTDINICSYTFGELVDISTIESVIFFGTEYKLQED